MSIRIETVKKVSDAGVIGRRVVKIEALPISKLPLLYVNQEGSVWQDGSSLGPYRRSALQPWAAWQLELKFYPEEEFQKRLEYIRKAGELLSRCRTELREKRESWKGEETFVI